MIDQFKTSVLYGHGNNRDEIAFTLLEVKPSYLGLVENPLWGDLREDSSGRYTKIVQTKYAIRLLEVVIIYGNTKGNLCKNAKGWMFRHQIITLKINLVNVQTLMKYTLGFIYKLQMSYYVKDENSSSTYKNQCWNFRNFLSILHSKHPSCKSTSKYTSIMICGAVLWRSVENIWTITSTMAAELISYF